MPALDGRRIVLTRSAEDMAVWARALDAAGAVVTELPCIRSETIADAERAAAFIAALPEADWLVFTSRRGVDAFAALQAPPPGGHTRIAAVGRATAERAAAVCGRVDLVSAGTAAVLGRQLTVDPRFAHGQRCVLAVAENASNELSDTLAAAGAHCLRFDLYRTIPVSSNEPKTRWSSLAAEAVIFASPTAVTGFVNRIELDGDCDIYSIGPSTSAAIRKLGLKLTAEAETPSLEAIIDAIAESMHV
jgi:uroporphyrinogen III methyltransferase/synthase